jgi:hypothetical protein
MDTARVLAVVRVDRVHLGISGLPSLCDVPDRAGEGFAQLNTAR